MSLKNNDHKSVRCEIFRCQKSFQFYLIEKHINYTKKSLNNLSANLNFLCDLKILSKMVPNGSNLMRFYITVKKKLWHVWET